MTFTGSVEEYGYIWKYIQERDTYYSEFIENRLYNNLIKEVTTKNTTKDDWGIPEDAIFNFIYDTILDMTKIPNITKLILDTTCEPKINVIVKYNNKNIKLIKKSGYREIEELLELPKGVNIVVNYNDIVDYYEQNLGRCDKNV